MAHRARVVALLAILSHMAVMRGAADQPTLPQMELESSVAATADDDFSVAAEWPLADPLDPTLPAASAGDSALPVAVDWSQTLSGSQPESGYHVFAAFEAISLAREIDDDQVFATLDTPTNDVLNANDLSFHQEAGMRVTVGAKLTQYYAVEVNFMSLKDWDDTVAVSDATVNAAGTAGNLFSPFTGFGSPPEVGLDFNDFASIRLISSVDTLEWNLRQRLIALETQRFAATAIYGFRYLGVGELLEYRTHSTLPLPIGSTGAVDVALENHLYGFQLGTALDYRAAPFLINLEGKAAICHNAVVEELAASIDSTADPVNEPIARIREAGSTAFLGHLSATVEIRFTAHCVGRAGYQALFVDGLALATQSGSAELLQDTSALYHGPIAGLVVMW